MSKMDTRTLVEASLLAALAAAIMVISSYVPVLSFIGTFAWSIPITILTFKYGIKTSILSLVVALIIGSIITGPLSALSLGIMYGSTAVVLGYCLKKEHSSFFTIAAMAVITFVGELIIIQFIKVLTAVNPIDEFFTILQESMDEAVKMMKSMGASDEQLKEFQGETFTQMMRMFFPGILALSSLLGSFIDYYLVQVIFKKLKYKVVEIKPIEEWYIGNNLGIGIFSASILSVILVYMKVPNAVTVYSSIFLLFRYAFVIQGLAVAYWFLKTKGVPRGFIIFLLVFSMFSVLNQLVFFIGFIDYIIDFRKINPRKRRRIPPGN